MRSVSQTGGHLGSNLGVVELTAALHHVFDLPKDKLIWDVSHQVVPGSGKGTCENCAEFYVSSTHRFFAAYICYKESEVAHGKLWKKISQVFATAEAL